MDNDPTAAGNAAGATTQGAASTGSQPEKDWKAEAIEYQKRFAGLQGKYQQEVEKLTNIQSELFSTKQSLSALTGEKEALALQLNALTGEKGKIEAKLAETDQKFGRINTIASKFPDLLPFETKGLLPDGVGDVLEQKLAAFRSEIGSVGKQQATQLLNGATPSAAPDKPAVRDARTVQREMNAAMKAGKYDDYNRLATEHVELLNKENK